MSTSLFHSFKGVQQTDRRLSFVVHKSHPYVVNALRRLMLSELYCAGIANQYHTGAHSVGIHVIKNSGRLHNEFLAHRFSMLHLALAPEHLQRHRFVMNLRMECPSTANEPISVTSNDIRLFVVKDGEREEVEDVTPYLVHGATQLIPTDPIVDRVVVTDVDIPKGVLITRLYPDEAVEVDLFPSVGRMCDYAGFAPLHTCTYEQIDTTHERTNDFRFTVDSLGSHDSKALVAQGLRGLTEKVELTTHLLEPRTVELVFGTDTPSLHTLLSGHTSTCWVRWSNVDFLTSLGAPESFYQQHCREVVASSAPTDVPLVMKPYPKDTPVPGVDGEDIHTSAEKMKLVLAMHQPTFATNGIYEYSSAKRKYILVDEPVVAYTIMKEGCTQRAMVYTPATIVQVHDDRCVLRFGADVDESISEHIVQHIDGVVCAGSGDGEPPVHLRKPVVARDGIQLVQETDKAFRVLVDEEDHTLGNLVQGYIYDKFLHTGKKKTAPKTTLMAVAYNKPLPSEKRIQFRFEYTKATSEKEFRQFFGQQLKAIHDELVTMGKKWT